MVKGTFIYGNFIILIKQKANCLCSGLFFFQADVDAGRPPRPEVTVTSPQENDENEQNKDSSAVA